MDYEKLYNEALKRAKGICNVPDQDSVTIARMEYLFPELKESDDEKIRKELKQLISCMHDKDPRKKDWLDWLEKQKSVDEIVERCKNSWYNEGKIAGQFEGITDDEKYQQGWHDALEKRGGNLQFWRPTKEQYEALDYAYNSCSDTERGNYYEGVLETLIEDLHRLEKQGEQQPADKV